MKPVYYKHGSGPAFVYISGIEGTGKLFYKQADDLGRDHTVITFPLRPTGSYAMPELVADLCWIVKDAVGERATILGESFGGLLAMSAALEHPEIFARMILVNTFPFFIERAKIRLGVTLFSVLPYSFMRMYRSVQRARNLFGEDVAPDDRRAFREHTRELQFEGYLSRLRIIRDTDLRGRLREIEVPTLIVAGTADRLLNSVAAGQLIAGSLPRAKLKLLPGTGHAALLSNRVRVRDWLPEFDYI